MSDPLDDMTEEELAGIIMAEISALETQGVRLPEGWRDQAASLGYLDLLLTTTLAQLKTAR